MPIVARGRNARNTVPLGSEPRLRARVWSPLLLKTNLLIQRAFRPGAQTGDCNPPPWSICSQYSGTIVNHAIARKCEGNDLQ